MGYAYYGTYPTYFEVARVEALRALGIRYADLESRGIMLPVRDLNVRYRAPLRYDELVAITTTIPTIPEGSRIEFRYELHNEAGQLCTEGATTLVSASTRDGRPVAMPEEVRQALQPYF